MNPTNHINEKAASSQNARTIDNQTIVPWALMSGEVVINRYNSHIHSGVERFLPEALGNVRSYARPFLSETVDLGRVVGESTCVETAQHDIVLFAQRHGRRGLSHFVQERDPVPTSKMTIILKRATPREYILITAWFGTQAQPEPWDPKASEQSFSFWTQHALIWGSEPIIPGTVTTCCPC